jgi:acyl-CoA dehydrogenase
VPDIDALESGNAAELERLVADIAGPLTDPPPGELPACWPTLVELGLPLVGIAERNGGAGGSLGDLLVVARAHGRHAIGSPLVDAATASWALEAATGEIGPGLHAVAAELPGAVRWGRHAADIVVLGHAAERVSTAACRLTPGLSLAGEPLDEVRPALAAERLGDTTLATAARARWGRLRAAELVGTAEGAYELTRGYVAQREQFGQALVRIPAVAANLALMRAAITQADAVLTRGSADDLLAAAVTRVLAAQAATEVAALAHQLHGAIGITMEYPLQRFTRRLWAGRDADQTERAWAALITEPAIADGETCVWELLTS